MSNPLQFAIHQALANQNLSADEMTAAIGVVMDGEASAVTIAALLTALRTKGETVDEIVGAARAMRSRALSISPQTENLLDTCGTGGDALHTFNISTATALVTAATGVSVAKHGNRSVSSSSGSADVLEALGVNIELSPEEVARSIDDIGIGFCFAPLLHGAMKQAAPVRKELGFRTIFNLLGPLTNPAKATYQLIGANSPANAEKMAHALVQLGCEGGMVVCGNDELDEVSLWGQTDLFRVQNGTVEHHKWSAISFGLQECHVDELKVSSSTESASVIRNILQGKLGAVRDIVLANSAVALIAYNQAEDPFAAIQIAADAIDTGKANELLEKLIAFK
ncbi:Anthranilate phosphoribosyltransferase [hydrothermal vent metagenome]|uniref:anthranilate phosphoribosyltransferase n=1 Tax=hydrothermal vent metagenome TaxID=652676 RepID=A0A3B1DNZ9_9ZZZZ